MFSNTSNEGGDKKVAAAVMFGGVITAATALFLPYGRALTLYQVENSLQRGFQHDGQGKYKGVWDVLKRIRKYEGTRALWRGAWYSFLSGGFGFVLSTELSTLGLENEGVKEPAKVDIFARLLGMQPFLYISTLLQADFGRATEQRRFGRGTKAFKQILKLYGVQGLYKGLLAYTVYDWSMTAALKYRNDAELQEQSAGSEILTMVSSVSTLILSFLLSNPLDVVVKRLMVQQLRDPQDVQFTNFREGVKYIYKNEGIRAFYRGTIWGIIFPLFMGTTAVAAVSGTGIGVALLD